MNIIKVTVLENATIFDASEQIHRFDLPSAGIVAGWAVPAVIDQIKTISSGSWPEVEVAIYGNDRAVELLTRTLLNKGVAAYDGAAVEEIAEQEHMPELHRPTSGSQKVALGTPSWFHVALVGVVVVALGVSWWAVDRTRTPADQVNVVQKEVAAPENNGEEAAPEQAPPPEPPAELSEVMEYDRVRLKLPPGFQINPRDDGILVATGEDPNLRILVAVDPLYGVDPNQVRTEIAASVEQDPELTLQPGRNLRVDEHTIEYAEDPGDGSEIYWVAWVADGNQFSVGCHSRLEVSIPQRAACRMAVESVQLK